MADRIRLEVVTPEREVFHAMVERFVVPAAIGPTAVLHNHAPLVTVLQPGVLRYVKDNEEGKIAVGEGFLEVRENEAELLVNWAQTAADIDVARAVAARDRALKRLRAHAEGVDEARANAALARALIRLQVAGYRG